jgi:hypothetical protein
LPESNSNSEENNLKKLKIHELEREIINLRVIITNIVIPKLLSVEILAVKEILKIRIRE